MGTGIKDDFLSGIDYVATTSERFGRFVFGNEIGDAVGKWMGRLQKNVRFAVDGWGTWFSSAAQAANPFVEQTGIAKAFKASKQTLRQSGSDVGDILEQTIGGMQGSMGRLDKEGPPSPLRNPSPFARLWEARGKSPFKPPPPKGLIETLEDVGRVDIGGAAGELKNVALETYRRTRSNFSNVTLRPVIDKLPDALRHFRYALSDQRYLGAPLPMEGYQPPLYKTWRRNEWEPLRGINKEDKQYDVDYASRFSKWAGGHWSDSWKRRPEETKALERLEGARGEAPGYFTLSNEAFARRELNKQHPHLRSALDALSGATTDRKACSDTPGGTGKILFRLKTQDEVRCLPIPFH